MKAKYQSKPTPSSDSSNSKYTRKEPEARELSNPTTTDVIYREYETVFIRAVESYRVKNNRPFPTYREILAIAISLGYRKVEEAAPMPVFKRGTLCQSSRD